MNADQVVLTSTGLERTIARSDQTHHLRYPWDDISEIVLQRSDLADDATLFVHLVNGEYEAIPFREAGFAAAVEFAAMHGGNPMPSLALAALADEEEWITLYARPGLGSGHNG